jgi:hypothetical protein
MDLERMLEKCHRDQWKVGDLDWTRTPREMSPEDEVKIVQYFTDMAGIERLAGALFEEQRRRVDDPTLREIFTTFVVDEVRHSHAAQMLADFYDVHRYRTYQQNEHLTAFTPAFVDAIRYLSPGIANAYITSGELLLDIALLRSLDAYVDDEMSHAAMTLINRDESRHLAIDYYMTEYYCSDEYAAKLASQPSAPFDEQLKAAWAFALVLYHAAPFFRDVFFGPMDLVDPEGTRLLAAFKRIQLLGQKDAVAKQPFTRFMQTMQALYNNPISGSLFGPVLQRIIGTDPRVIVRLYDEAEVAWARRATFAEMAEEALQQKYVN